METFRLAFLVAIAWSCAIALLLGKVKLYSTIPDGVQAMYYFLDFQGSIIYCLIIPQSYNISFGIGLGATFSGSLIGMFKLGLLVGAFCVWCLSRKNPEIWRHPFKLILPGLVLQVLGCAMYLYAAHAVSENYKQFSIAQLSASESIDYSLATLLVASRIVLGIGPGVVGMLAFKGISHLFAPEDRPAWGATQFFCNSMGAGLGPMFASVALIIDGVGVESKPDANERCHVVALVALVMTLCSCCLLLCALPFLPSLSQVQDYSLGGIVSSEASADRTRKIVLVLSSLVFVVSRAFVVSSLEAATALLLELNFKMGESDVGLVVGSCFLACLPVKVLHACCNHFLSIQNWLRLLTAAALGGAFLLFPFFPDAHLLVFGDSLLFPCFFISSGLALGVMQQHLFPRGSCLSIDNVSMIQIVLVDGFGRNLGPPAGRYQVHTHGQLAYALQQIAVTGAAFVWLEFLIIRNMSSSLEGTKRALNTARQEAIEMADQSRARWQIKD